MTKQTVLFVCIHNSARSQMAEGFLNALGKEKFIAESAGIEAGTLNPRAVQVMQEIGIDISHHYAKEAITLIQQGKQYDYIITVCDAKNSERCPVFPGAAQRLAWMFDDPSSATGTEEEKLALTRRVRDEIKEAVVGFVGGKE